MVAERLASSVLRQVQFQLRNSKEVMQVLGENVKMAPEWWSECTFAPISYLLSRICLP